MKSGKYFKVGKNSYLEHISDEEAKEKYGNKDKRILVMKGKHHEHHELISPFIIVDEE